MERNIAPQKQSRHFGLELNVGGSCGAKGEQAKYQLFSALDSGESSAYSPISPDSLLISPPCSPPSHNDSERHFHVKLGPSSSSVERPCTPDIEPLSDIKQHPMPIQSLLPSCFDAEEINERDSLLIESECSECSVESLRNSSGFHIGTFKPSLISYAECAICKGTNLLQLNGVELDCGHFAHRCCLKDKTKVSDGVRPPCSICDHECVESKYLRRASPSKLLDTQIKKTKDDLAANRELEQFGQGKIPDIAPLRLQMFSYSHSVSSHEILLRVSTPAHVFDKWKYNPTGQDVEVARRCTSTALGVASMDGSRVCGQISGQFRFTSVLRDSRTQAKILGYLFEYAVIFTHITTDGFEELVKVIDLRCNDVDVIATDNSLIFVMGREVMTYTAPQEIIATWISATHNLSLRLPIARPCGVREFENVDRCVLHMVICLPFKHLPAVPHVLSELGPLDKLGIVVTEPSGSCAWISPQKTNWSGWATIAKDYTNSFDLFTPATQPVLQTAEILLGPKATRVQKCVTLVAGCSLESTTIEYPIHVVGIGDYDLNLLSNIATESGGQFHHAHSVQELAVVLAGIAAAERAYTHHNVTLSVVVDPGLQVVEILGLDKQGVQITSNRIEFALGSLIAGQSRTILLEVNGVVGPGHSMLSEYHVKATSAITGTTQWQNQVDTSGLHVRFQIFFERMVSLAAEILRQGVDLIGSNQLDELLALVTRAVLVIQRAIAGCRNNSKKFSSPLLELSDHALGVSLEAAQAETLSHGLQELRKKFINDWTHGSEAKGALLQASLVLQSQRAVTRRTLIEQLFMENLDTNRL